MNFDSLTVLHSLQNVLNSINKFKCFPNLVCDNGETEDFEDANPMEIQGVWNPPVLRWSVMKVLTRSD